MHWQPRTPRGKQRCENPWTNKAIGGLTGSTENLIPETEEENTRNEVVDSSNPDIQVSEKTFDVIAALRDGYRLVEKRGNRINEAETRMLLIEPVLDALGFPPSHRKPEDGDRGNRPDEICYDTEVSTDTFTAAIILEAKSLDSDFDVQEHPGRRGSSPDRQIQRYLRQHVTSDDSTLGILTDGLRWRLYDRSGLDVTFVHEYDFAKTAKQFWRSSSSFTKDAISDFDEFIEIATRCYESPKPIISAVAADPVLELFNSIIEAAPPSQILRHLIPDEDIDLRYDIADYVTLTGLQQDTFENDWEDHVYLIGPRTIKDGQLSMSDHLAVAVLKFSHSEAGLGRSDVATSARIFSRSAGSGMSVLLVYSTAPDGTAEARLAVCAEGKVNMTAAFDPDLPAPSARIAIGQILEVLSRDAVVSAEDLMLPLEVAPLRQRFYREVSQWTWNLQENQPRPYRQAVLKHLIRVIFTWILKEESIIPPEIFEYAYAVNHLDDINNYHNDVLTFLFHERLNVVEDHRDPHSTDALNEILDLAPFLNGSLFARNGEDVDLDIPAELYWNSDESRPGLFTIFSRYHWTTDEHRPGESEQTLDPELLSNLFEQLITPTEEGQEPPPRQPRGTYYTPADVADEMVKDALVAAVSGYAPKDVTTDELLDLFGDPDAAIPEIDDADKTRLISRIRELRIFDPAVGSGEFLFSCLIALKTALSKIDGVGADTTREIIKGQLAGQDINALATQITRLRLFIAIESAEKQNPSHEPLPNLEARIVCADTLETIADPNWQLGRSSSLGDCEPDFAVCLSKLAENRNKWFDAHSEQEKSRLREVDDELREKLRAYLKENGNDTVTSSEFKGFVDFPLLGTDLVPARTDPRLLFYEPDRSGFDIVIGNPPYERLSKSVNAKRKQVLIEDKGYQTTNVNDLYTLFCEVGLALAKPDGGVVTMIVPLSIAFGQRQRTIRKLFEKRCGQINLRHYDIRPSAIFKESFTVKTPPNSQRATIFTALLTREAQTILRTTGLQRWGSLDRAECLNNRNIIPLLGLDLSKAPYAAQQWARIPTVEVAEMVQRITEQSTTIASFIGDSGPGLAFPKSARYYLSVTPSGTVSPRRETEIRLVDSNALKTAIAVLNGHVGLAWWTIFGDGLDVKVSDFLNLTVPDTWISDDSEPIALGERLVDAIPECFTEPLTQHRRVWRNVNFHLKPDLIEELDRLHIEALGLDVEPLLTHLRIMCSSSSWDFSSSA